MLRDVPILFMDLFDEFSLHLLILERLLDSPQTKFFELGTHQLLTGYFRGTRMSRVPQVVGGKRDWNKTQVSLVSAPEPKRVGEEEYKVIT